MDVNRRHLLAASAAGAAGAITASAETARAARAGSQYGVHPGSPNDQTEALQRAIDEATRAEVPLALPPGVYRTGQLRLARGGLLGGVRGATKLVFTGGESMILSESADGLTLSGITLDGGGIALAPRRGLI